MRGTEEHSDEDETGGFVDEENQGIQGKMFVNQHMIKLCFGDESLKGSFSKEENKAIASSSSRQNVSSLPAMSSARASDEALSVAFIVTICVPDLVSVASSLSDGLVNTLN